ncbi:MAG: hypothetical protein SH856_14655 [Flavobacteriales bacterium]|nr:hypothetical protein [Flavobacteriales bacterium]
MKKLGIIYEHPEWHEPLFSALEKAGIAFSKIDLKNGAFHEGKLPWADVYYNLVSPSAYLRGHQRAIPYAMSLCRNLEVAGKRVINGSQSMSFEFSKSAQAALMRRIGVDHPQSYTFNTVEALKPFARELKFPMLLKPDQGGSGARMYQVNAFEEIESLFALNESLWLPDYVFLLQEKLEYDPAFGIVRVEFVGGKYLYAMRVVSHGAFNLCPSVVCNPEDGEGHCEIPESKPTAKPEFYPYPEITQEIIEQGRRIMETAGHTIGSVEFLFSNDGRTVFYDINSNSNLREPIARHFRIEPFDHVANFLKAQLN